MCKIQLLLFLVFNLTFSQDQKKEIYVKYIDSEISVDGVLDENDWSSAKTASNFYEHFPNNGSEAIYKSEIKVMNDDQFLYVGIKVNANTSDLKVSSLKRDFSAGNSDNITMIFDTFNDATNAFVFGSNHIGVQREMLLFNGGNDLGDWEMTWDKKWKCESKQYQSYYITEWKIPLSAFKYREGETKWRVGSYQRDTKNNAWNSWHKVPKNQQFFNLAFMGDMIFEKPLGRSKSVKSIIPYVNSLSFKDYENSNSGESINFGADVKLTIDNSLTLDLTINPDFSQVEVDQQVTNLTRYEVTLPEKRQFFIENSDLFSNFGNSKDANPFFTRRIGIGKDLNGNSIQNKIDFGMRLSGKLNNNFRIGLLNMQTQEDIENEIAATNNSIVALQHKVFNRSNVSFIFINKQATKDYDFSETEKDYNRLIGLDYNLASKDNKWNGKYYIHKSFTEEYSDKDLSVGVNTTYNTKNISFRLSGLYVGDNFNSELGYIKRTGVIKVNPNFSYKFWPKGKKIQTHNLEVTPVYIWRPELNNELSDRFIIGRWGATQNNSSTMGAVVNNRYTLLYRDFDPTGSNGVPLPVGSEFNFTYFEAYYSSPYSEDFSYKITPSFGEFFNGKIKSLELQLSYRIQPKFNSSIRFSYDKINLPDPYPSANILLVAPRIDYTFTKNLYWAALVQYSNQRDNLSLNTRLQWRFAPLSDLFLVYSDNYFTENRYDSLFIPRIKSRSINLKLTYWLDI
tara:strand:+ start:739 stop:2949 length:2211 start_codon:yes stop_codon:yes gene_type:complete